MNSVDLSCSIVVKFCVEYNGMRVTIPPSIAGLKKQHTKNAGTVAKDYISMVSQVKPVWQKIITQFPKQKMVDKEVDEENTLVLGDTLETLKIGQKMGKFIKKRMDKITASGKDFTLWDVFAIVMERIGSGNFKSDVHKQRKVDSICKAIFTYATLLGL